jgi:predicted nucleic acid-binding protein
MKIVLDTNVLIFDIYSSGPPGNILQALCKWNLQLCMSLEILEEYLNKYSIE